MEEAIYQLLAVTAGFLGGAMMWRGDALEAKAARKSEEALRRYRWAVDELDRWCGHVSPHARIIAAHITAVGEGGAKNAGTPCGMEVCTIQGTRQQLQRLDAQATEKLEALESLMADTEWLKAELSTRVAT